MPVPVEKPYPVPIPHVRPVFHHSRPMREEADVMGDVDSERDTDDDYYTTRHRKPDFPGAKKILIRAKKQKRLYYFNDMFH